MNILIAILVIGTLIAIHEAGHFWVARWTGMKVLRYSIGFLHPIIKWTSKKTGIVYQIGIIPLGGFVQIKGMNPFEEDAYTDPGSYQTKAAWKRMAVILAGPAANFLLAWAMLFGLYSSGVPESVNESRVGQIVKGAPADEAGLKLNDRVLEFNGEKISTWDELAGNLHENPEKDVSLLIERDGEQMTVKVTPMLKNGIGLIGIHQPTTDVRLPIHEAAHAALAKCTSTVSLTVTSLAGWISGKSRDVSPVGPVGIVKMAASTLDSGLAHFLAFVSYLSIMLFMFNMFPLPALDGGRGVFLLYEVISRRRVNKKVDAAVNTIGFVLLLGMIILITFKEIFFG